MTGITPIHNELSCLLALQRSHAFLVFPVQGLVFLQHEVCAGQSGVRVVGELGGQDGGRGESSRPLLCLIVVAQVTEEEVLGVNHRPESGCPELLLDGNKVSLDTVILIAELPWIMIRQVHIRETP